MCAVGFSLRVSQLAGNALVPPCLSSCPVWDRYLCRCDARMPLTCLSLCPVWDRYLCRCDARMPLTCLLLCPVWDRYLCRWDARMRPAGTAGREWKDDWGTAGVGESKLSLDRESDSDLDESGSGSRKKGTPVGVVYRAQGSGSGTSRDYGSGVDDSGSEEGNPEEASTMLEEAWSAPQGLQSAAPTPQTGRGSSDNREEAPNPPQDPTPLRVEATAAPEPANRGGG
eukprot:1187021-Prorocentrum_minimum.AAC.4